MAIKQRKKLIEVALPLDAINAASAHEKMPGIGPHPRGLHLWWARRPLAAARAVIFSQLVDDPSTYTDVLLADSKLRRKAESVLKARLKVWDETVDTARKATEGNVKAPTPGPKPTVEQLIAEIERERLFAILRDLVLWENTTNESVIQAARDEIWASWRRACAENADHPESKQLFNRKRLPPFHDPFAGGGALPVEAQRLGFEAYASDLNPVAVLINKAMIEIPPQFAGKPPVNPEAQSDRNLFAREWKDAQGLAADVRYYGKWMRDEAQKRIGKLYPPIEVTAEMAKGRPDLRPYVGRKLTVIAWLWARTVESPDPAFSKVQVPLASTFLLSTKKGNEAFVDPIVGDGGYEFKVRFGKPRNIDRVKAGTSAGKRAAFKCLMSGTPITYDYIRTQGQAGHLGVRLMAIVAEGDRGRVYLSPTKYHETTALTAKPAWTPTTPLHGKCRVNVSNYGFDTFGDLFTSRQLVALTLLSDLVQEAREKVQRDGVAAGLAENGTGIRAEGLASTGYSEAVSVYLAFGVDRCADFSNSCTRWVPGNQKVMNLFGKQAIAMTWDFPEAAILHKTVGGFEPATTFIAECIEKLPVSGSGRAQQQDAMTSGLSAGKIVSTDPPYYDNIGYADLSDFFYVWLRRSIKPIFPDLFATLAVPKGEELVATPYRHGSKEAAEAFFLEGMTRAMRQLAIHAHPAFPITIYYAFKQSENDAEDGTTNTGWDTFLAALMDAGFEVSGTWPMRSEQEFRMIGMGANALASSIILVCRPRHPGAPTVTRREFLTALKAELPAALAHLQRGNIAPVDLAQAAIGPGMSVYTRYGKVIDAEGRPLCVRDALALINENLAEALSEQEGDFDSDTRWALTWFEQHGFAEGEYGTAEQLSKSKNTSVDGLRDAGIVESKRGKVRLLKPSELPDDWDALTDPRLTAWEIAHHLIRILGDGGEGEAARVVSKLGAASETARELAYRLYAVCERKKRAAEAMAYNGLVQSWPEIVRLARQEAKPAEKQGALFEEIDK